MTTSKRILLLGFAVIGIFLMALPVIAYSGGKANCKKASSSITIDGDLNDPSWLAVQADFAPQSLNQPDDIFYIFTPITNRGTPAAFWGAGLQQEATLNDSANGHAVAVKTATGYIAEVRIPWSLLEPFYGGPFVDKEGMVMGFDLSFVDSDPTYATPIGGAMAWSSDFENDNSPSVLGELFFVPGGESAVSPANKLSSTWGDIKSEN